MVHSNGGYQKTSVPSGSWQELPVPQHVDLRITWMISWYSSLLLPERVAKREQEGSHNAFYALILYIIHCHYYHIVFSRNKSLSTTHTGEVQIGRSIKEFVEQNCSFIHLFIHPFIHLNTYDVRQCIRSSAFNRLH